ncbi:MAG: J domain-containing protein [Chloroflexi bacterium]|nr:J domain-containing protein [Chloroflexota bacterium]
MAKDFYAELGVPRDADEKQIKTAYRRLARRYHPDMNPGDDGAETRFKSINDAYQVLSDSKKRRDYDEFGDNWKHAEQIRETSRSRGSGFRSGVRPSSGFGGFEDLFGGLGGSAFGRPQRQTLRTTAQITLEEAYSGSKRTVTIQGSAACPACHGTGVDGTVLCPTCGGSGALTQPRTLEVTIPAGTAAGDRIRVRPDETMEVTIEVDIRKHRVYTRKGDDLTTDVSVSYLDALLGGEVEVPTMSGKVVLRVPPGTVEGRNFRLGGRGMPRHGRGATGHGDLVAKVVISVPKDLSDQEKGLLERLRQLREGVPEGAAGTDAAAGGDA